MTAAERQAASRANRKAKQEDAERRNLVAELMRVYNRQQASIVDDGETPETTAERHRIARKKKRQYHDDLMQLSLADLRSALEVQQENVDTRGRLHNERSGARSYKEAGELASIINTGRVTPSGAGSDSDEPGDDDDATVRTGGGGFWKQGDTRFNDALDEFVREHVRDLDRDFEEIKRLCDSCCGEDFVELKILFDEVKHRSQCGLCGWVTTWGSFRGHFLLDHNAYSEVKRRIS